MINESPAPKPTPIRPEFAGPPVDPGIKVPESVRRAALAHKLASPKSNGTTNVIPYPKGLERLPFDIPPEEVAEIINDMRKTLATIADPVEAVQWAKTGSVALLGWFTDREDKFTPEARAEAEQIAEVLLAGHPRKNAKGETIQMSIDEAFALYSEQDKVQRRGLENDFAFTPADISKSGFAACDHFQKWVFRS